MTSEGEDETYTLLPVPDRFVGRVEEYLKQCARESAAALAIQGRSPEDPGASSNSARIETPHELAFITYLFRFAFDTYGCGAKRTAAHLIVVVALFLAEKRLEQVAIKIVDLATKDQDITNQFENNLFKGTDESKEWPRLVREAIKARRMKPLGKKVCQRVSTANKKDILFLSFKADIERRYKDDQETRNRYLEYLASLVPPVFWWPHAPAADRSIPLKTAGQNLSIKLGSAILGIVVIIILARPPRDPKVDDKNVAMMRGHGAISSATISLSHNISVGSVDIPEACQALSNGYDTKNCIITEADRERERLEIAEKLYKTAIAYTYDSVGLGKRQRRDIFGIIPDSGDRDRGSVDEQYLCAAQTLNAYDGLASLYSIHNQTRLALEAFRERVKVQQGLDHIAVHRDDLFVTGDCNILLALEFGVHGGAAALTARSSCSGEDKNATFPQEIGGYPSNLGDLMVYIEALAYADASQYDSALYASVTLLDVLWGASADRIPVRKYWEHLMPPRVEAMTIMDRCLMDAALRLQAERQAIVLDDLVIWIHYENPKSGAAASETRSAPRLAVTPLRSVYPTDSRFLKAYASATDRDYSASDPSRHASVELLAELTQTSSTGTIKGSHLGMPGYQNRIQTILLPRVPARELFSLDVFVQSQSPNTQRHPLATKIPLCIAPSDSTGAPEFCPEPQDAGSLQNEFR